MRPIPLYAHTKPVTWVQYNYDGDLLFTTGKEPVAKVWLADTGRQLGDYTIRHGAIYNCDVTYSSKYIALAAADQHVSIFEVETGRNIWKIDLPGACRFVEWNRKPNDQRRFAVVVDSFQSTKPSIKIYTFDDRDPENVEPDLSISLDMRCGQVRWGPMDLTLISAHEGGVYCVWNAVTGELLDRIVAHTAANKPLDLSFNKDRTLMLTCSIDGTGKLWDAVNCEELKTYTTDRPLNAGGVSPLVDEGKKYHILMGGGQEAMSVTTTGASEGKFEALLWNLVNEEELGSIRGGYGPLNTLAWMPDGGGYAIGGEEGFARIYKFDDVYWTNKFD